MDVATHNAGARVVQDALHNRPALAKPLWHALQASSGRRRRGAQVLAQAPDHRARIAHHRMGRTHEPTIAADQRRALLLATRLEPNRETAASDAAQPMANPPGRAARDGAPRRPG